MSKKIGITLIAVALVITVAYAIVAGVTFYDECPVETTTPKEVETVGRAAEVIYNSFMYTDGSYEYAIQVYVDSAKAVKDLNSEQGNAKKRAMQSAFDTIETAFKQSGIAIKKSEDLFISVVLASYDSATDRALASGETGYDIYESNAEVYNGFWYNWYVSESKTVFADTQKDGWLNYIVDVLTNQGGLNSDEIDFVFNYGTKYSVNTIASDADAIYYYTNTADGVSCYVHEFRMTDATRGRTIKLVQSSPNVWSWYLIAIVAVLFATGVTVLAVGSKRR